MLNNANTVAVVGTGLVGSGWAIVFARAGLQVLAYDAEVSSRSSCLAGIATSLTQMQQYGLIEDPKAVLNRIRIVDTLQDAVGPADYIQESVFERVDVKTAVSKEIGALVRPDAAVGSSSSGIPASAFTAEAPKRSRFLVAHPVNPPHLVPVVELVPAPWTDPDAVDGVRALMDRVEQLPVTVTREIEGFVLNRLQGALLREAWALLEEGYASAADIDRTVSDGLGLRWSFMGPFETIDLNAPGGIDDYARRLGGLYHGIAASRANPQPWSDELIEKARVQRREALPMDGLVQRSEWRNERLMALIAHRRAMKAAKGA